MDLHVFSKRGQKLSDIKLRIFRKYLKPKAFWIVWTMEWEKKNLLQKIQWELRKSCSFLEMIKMDIIIFFVISATFSILVFWYQL
jgi:hypothetical protein